MSHAPGESPVNPIPPLILALFVLILGVELAFQLGARGLAGGPQAIGWRQSALTDFGFQGQYPTFMVETGQIRADYLLRFVSYPFVHGSFTQAIFAGIMLLALGKFVGEIMAPVAVFVLFVVSTIGGALAMWGLGGAQDCPYTFMKDMVAGTYRLPWEDEVVHTDGTSCGFERPTRRYGERKLGEAAE